MEHRPRPSERRWPSALWSGQISSLLSHYISQPLFGLLFHSTLTLLDPLTYYPTYSNPHFPQFPLSPFLFLFPKTHTLLRFCTLDFTPTFVHLFFHSSPYNHTTRPSTHIQDLLTCCIMGKTSFTLVQVPHSPQSSTTHLSPWILLPSSSERRY